MNLERGISLPQSFDQERARTRRLQRLSTSKIIPMKKERTSEIPRIIVLDYRKESQKNKEPPENKDEVSEETEEVVEPCMEKQKDNKVQPPQEAQSRVSTKSKRSATSSHRITGSCASYNSSQNSIFDELRQKGLTESRAHKRDRLYNSLCEALGYYEEFWLWTSMGVWCVPLKRTLNSKLYGNAIASVFNIRNYFKATLLFV